MGFRKRGGNPDANNQDIADLGRRLGFQVAITTQVGFDFPDQVWGGMGHTILVEVTNPNLKPSKKTKERKARQAAFRANWPGGLAVELKTGQDVIALVERLRESCHQCGRMKPGTDEATRRKEA